MTSESRHVCMSIARTADDVYDYVRDPANLPAWAHGLGGSIRQVDGRWYADTPDGPIGIAFAPPNPFGVVDHDITLPDHTVLHVAMRVLPDGDDCEVVFTARRAPGMSDADFERDVDAVRADLLTLRQLLQRR